MKTELRYNAENTDIKRLLQMIKDVKDKDVNVTIVCSSQQWNKLLNGYRDEVIDEIIDHIEKAH